MKAAKNGGRKSAGGASSRGRKSEGFTAEERLAMKERVEELKSQSRGRRGLAKPDAEKAVLAKIAAWPPADRAIGERVHALIRANAPELTPRT